MRRAALAMMLVGGAAFAQSPAADAPSPFDRARCDEPKRGGAPLTPAEALECRDGWTKLMEESRARSKAWQEEARQRREERRAAANARAATRKVDTSIERFVGEELAFGDIVVTDSGPRVYVGQSYVPARLEDFVTLDAPRSPHKSRADAVRRAARPNQPAN